MQLSIDGATFDVLVEGNGPALVLLHAFGLTKESWNSQAAALAERARVVRFDSRGLGRSSVTAGPYLMESLASDVASVLDALHVERAVVVGHSLGGYVAYAFYRLFAERCLGLGIVCSRANADDATAANAREALACQAETAGMVPVADAFVPRYFAPAVYRERPQLVDEARAIVLRNDPHGAAATLRGMAARVSSEDLLEEIDIPVRVIAGAEDGFASVATMRAVAKGIRGAKLDVFDCGHLPPWEAPDAMTASLAALLQDVEAARASRRPA